MSVYTMVFLIVTLSFTVAAIGIYMDRRAQRKRNEEN